eukprot:134499-Chlamydomonas_euryale.AAC.1
MRQAEAAAVATADTVSRSSASVAAAAAMTTAEDQGLRCNKRRQQRGKGQSNGKGGHQVGDFQQEEAIVDVNGGGER